MIDIKMESLFEYTHSRTRGHAHRLKVSYLAHTNKVSQFFAHRVINTWNALPQEAAEACTLARFKTHLTALSYNLIKSSLIRS